MRVQEAKSLTKKGVMIGYLLSTEGLPYLEKERAIGRKRERFPQGHGIPGVMFRKRLLVRALLIHPGTWIDLHCWGLRSSSHQVTKCSPRDYCIGNKWKITGEGGKWLKSE